MRTIVCFGDSNTHGANPVDQARFPRDVRWPGVLRADLGPEYEVIEEGLNARTTVFVDPLADDRSGKSYLQPCLWSHQPVDLVTIMLGTNDLKTVFGADAPAIANGAAHLVDLARRSLAGPDDAPPRVLLIAPPPLAPMTDRSELWGFGTSRVESGRLAGLYRLVAEMRGIPFLDAGSVVTTSPHDGVHLDAEAHLALGHAVATMIREVFAGS